MIMEAKSKRGSTSNKKKICETKIEIGPRTPKRKIRDDVTVARSPFSRNHHDHSTKRDTDKKGSSGTNMTRKWKSNTNSRPTKTFDETLIRRAADMGDPYGMLGRNIFGSLKRM